jgi:hypothetical protein
MRFPVCIILAALPALALSLAACVHRARLYDLQDATILQASFKYSGTGQGAIWLGGKSLNTAPCKGEYTTVAGGTVGWGTIYSGTQVSTATISTMSAEQRGSAVATCTDGTVYECEYVTSAWTAAGNGACQDNRGRRYRLMF